MFRYLAVLLLLPGSLLSLPLRFERHQQSFTTRGVTLTPTGPLFRDTIRMDLVGATWTSPQPDAAPTASTDYFTAHSHTRVPQYDRVRYRPLYPGIDLVFHAAEAT